MMAIDLNAGAIQNVFFDNPSGAVGLTQSSLILWFDRDTPSNYREAFVVFSSGANEFVILLLDFGNAIYDAGKFTFISWNFSGGAGEWYTTDDVLVNGLNMIGITYDSALTSNKPILYHQGISVARTDRATPSGTLEVGSDADIYVGSFGTNSPDGRYVSCLRYNRILSAEEMFTAYKSRLAVPFKRGLVFAPILWGCEGRQEFNGLTLTGTDFILDPISRALGTPNGSPVGYGDQHLMIGEMA